MKLPIKDRNLQVLPNSGIALGPGNSEYSFAIFKLSCVKFLRTNVDSPRQCVILEFHNRLTTKAIISRLQTISTMHIF